MRAGIQVFGDEFGECERRRHDQKLRQQGALRVDELREEGAEEEQHLRVRDGREQALQEQRAAVAVRRRFVTGNSTACSAQASGRRRANTGRSFACSMSAGACSTPTTAWRRWPTKPVSRTPAICARRIAESGHAFR